MFMLLKSQTKAIKIIFSLIPNQPKSEVSNLTCSSDVVYITYLSLIMLPIKCEFVIVKTAWFENDYPILA